MACEPNDPNRPNRPYSTLQKIGIGLLFLPLYIADLLKGNKKK